MNDEASRPPKQKKPYSKPDVSQVSLQPEEAVLGACKVSTSSGPGQAKCNVPSACSSLTS
jgi:hypothetical protein